jgi:hypothetical protein
MSMFDLASQNLTSPMVLFFVLGLFAASSRSDLAVPEAIAKILSLYLLMSIGFRGGVEMAHQGVSMNLASTMAAGIALSFAMPLIGYALLRWSTKLGTVDAAVIAAHYGSISAVTLAAIISTLGTLNLSYDGYMVAVAAAMETPAILSGLFLANRKATGSAQPGSAQAAAGQHGIWREALLNGSVVMLLGAFLIGIASGTRDMGMIKPFVLDLFPGALCFFLLDMGIIAGRGLKDGWKFMSVPVIFFAIAMPLLGASLATFAALTIGLQAGSAAILITLAASASYIAVPAAMRMALPQANLSLALTLSLGVTFPFNLTLGIPAYIAIARWLAG